MASSPVHEENIVSRFTKAGGHSTVKCVVSRACERSGKRSEASQKSGGAERIGERAWQQTMELEWSAKWEVVEREQSIEQAESVTHSPLQRI